MVEGSWLHPPSSPNGKPCRHDEDAIVVLLTVLEHAKQTSAHMLHDDALRSDTFQNAL